MEVSGELHKANQFSQGEAAIVTPWVGGLVGIRGSLDALESRRISLYCLHPVVYYYVVS
jgi:hypothetical protein